MLIKSILIINRDPARKSPRALRFIAWLAPLYKVHVLSFKDESYTVETEASSIQYHDVDHLPKDRINRIGRLFFKIFAKIFPFFYNFIVFRDEDSLFKKKLFDVTVDIILCQSLDLLPYAFLYKKSYPHVRIIFDAREFYPDQGCLSFAWRLLFRGFVIWMCRTYLSRCDYVITVSDDIKLVYEATFNISCYVIPSYPVYTHQKPSCIKMSEIRMIHHGSCSRQRELSRMIDLLSVLDDRFSLTFMLTNDDFMYKKSLQKYALEKGVNHRFNMHDPVAFRDITQTLNDYDIGLYYLKKTMNRNHEYALPNKFFEYIQGRLMLVISARTSMKFYVDKYVLGIAHDDIKILAQQLNCMTHEDIQKYKNKAHQVAYELSDASIKKDFLRLLQSVS